MTMNIFFLFLLLAEIFLSTPLSLLHPHSHSPAIFCVFRKSERETINQIQCIIHIVPSENERKYHFALSLTLTWQSHEFEFE